MPSSQPTRNPESDCEGCRPWFVGDAHAVFAAPVFCKKPLDPMRWRGWDGDEGGSEQPSVAKSRPAYHWACVAGWCAGPCRCLQPVVPSRNGDRRMRRDGLAEARAPAGDSAGKLDRAAGDRRIGTLAGNQSLPAALDLPPGRQNREQRVGRQHEEAVLRGPVSDVIRGTIRSPSMADALRAFPLGDCARRRRGRSVSMARLKPRGLARGEKLEDFAAESAHVPKIACVFFGTGITSSSCRAYSSPW